MRGTKLAKIVILSVYKRMYFASEKLLLKFKIVLRLLFLLSLLTDKADPGTVKPQIIGGEDARPGEFPWMISIQYFARDEWQRGCGGAIIDHRHIITAAHCWLRKSYPHRVVVGAHNISDENETSRQIHEPCRFHQHPMWNSIRFTNDMMVVTLNTSIKFNDKVQPVRLAPSDSDPVGQVCVVSGWGFLGSSEEPTILQKCNLTVISLEECLPWSEAGPFVVDEYNVCTLPEKMGKGTTKGDSGSALICYDEKGPYATGVVSWGPKAGEGDVYGGVKVHLEFIKCEKYKG